MKIRLIALLTLLSSFSSLFAQEDAYPSADFSNPRATVKYFLKTMKGYKLGDERGLDLALEALDLSAFDKETRLISGRTAAIRLVNTIDRLEYVDYKTIPDQYKGDYWVFKKKEAKIDNQRVTYKIALSLNKEGQWLFDKDTLQNIGQFLELVKSKDVVEGVESFNNWQEKVKRSMPEWTGRRTFILLNGQWLALLCLIFISFLTERILRFILLGFLVEGLHKKNIRVPKELKEKLVFPLKLFVFAAFWSVGVQLLEFEDGLLSWFMRGGQVAFTVACIRGAYQRVDYVCLYLENKAIESENKFDDILVPLIRKSAKTFVVAIGIIAIGDSLTLDMKGLLAGMGIAGLGLSLAAKDTLSNLFGSLTVLLDRPFRIGDWVKINDSIEGMVEEVGLRSCRIRTFYNSLITIPNGMLTNASIDNLGVRQYRRFTTTLCVQYDTPVEKVEDFCEGIRSILKEHPCIRKDYFHVYLNNLGAHSLDILLYAFFETPDWSEELNQRHRLLVDILRLGHSMGVEFAFPTQTLHVVNSEATKYDGLPLEDKIDLYAKEKAQGVLEKPISPPEARSSI